MFKLFGKILRDSLTTRGKYDRKSLTAFVYSMAGLVYIFVFPFVWRHLFNQDFEHYAFTLSLIVALSGSTVAMTMFDKTIKSNKQDDDIDGTA